MDEALGTQVSPNSWTCQIDGWLLENQFSEAQSVAWAGRPWGDSGWLGGLCAQQVDCSSPPPAPEALSPTLHVHQAVPRAWRPSLVPFLGP